MAIPLSTSRVRFPVKVNQVNILYWLNDYCDKSDSSILLVRDVGDQEATSFWRQTNPAGWAYWIKKTSEANVEDEWIWVKHINGLIWPADGPADRQFAMAKFYKG